MNQEDMLTLFNEFAQEKIKEHTSAIKDKYNNQDIPNHIRLQVFNEHLDELKFQLQSKIAELVESYKTDATIDVSMIKSKHLTSYNNIINEFYKMEF